MEHLLEEHVSTEDLKKFETRYQTELNGGQVSTSAQFDYAWCLVRSRYPSDIRKGLLLLEDLCRVSFGLTHQFFKSVFLYTKYIFLFKNQNRDESGKRDYLFYLAIGNARIKEYQTALKFIRGLLQVEPGNRQAQELETIIQKKMEKEGLIGMAVVGGATLALGGKICRKDVKSKKNFWS